MDKPITAVLIDTSAYQNRQCDFAGITSAMIPTFLRLLESNYIPVLSHPILDNEIRNHIKESNIIKRSRDLRKSVKKCKELLASLGFIPEEILCKTDTDNIEKIFIDAYENFSRNFVELPYVDAQSVFEDYFNTKAPFSAMGTKKSEFPDAFILKGLLDFCEKNPESKVLVVSGDSDWQKTLSENMQIEIVKTLKEALAYLWKQLDDKKEFVCHLWSSMMPNIMKAIDEEAEHEAFCIDGIFELEDIEISRIHTAGMVGNMTPIDITDTSVLVHVSAWLHVDGIAEYFDENRSLWDKEDQCYYFNAYTRMSFKDAIANVECEVQLDFPSDGSMNPITVNNVRITNKWDISLDVSNAETNEEDITDYDGFDWRSEQAETLEEYYKH